MTPLSGLKRSMPCEDLCSMMVLTSSASTASMMTPPLIKDYDSDDASATSCIELSSLLRLNNRILASYNDQGDTFIDDVWDFQSIDVGSQSSSKRQKYNSWDAAQCPATEALTLVLEESQDTLDKLMDMHIHRISPIEPMYPLQRFNGRTMV